MPPGMNSSMAVGTFRNSIENPALDIIGTDMRHLLRFGPFCLNLCWPSPAQHCSDLTNNHKALRNLCIAVVTKRHETCYFALIFLMRITVIREID